MRPAGPGVWLFLDRGPGDAVLSGGEEVTWTGFDISSFGRSGICDRQVRIARLLWFSPARCRPRWSVT